MLKQQASRSESATPFNQSRNMMFTNTQATQNMLHDTGLTSQLINGGSTQVSNCGGINNFLEKTAILNDTRQDRRPRT